MIDSPLVITAYTKFNLKILLVMTQNVGKHAKSDKNQLDNSKKNLAQPKYTRQIIQSVPV